MRREDDKDGPYSIILHSDVDMERDGDDKEEKDVEQKDEEQEEDDEEDEDADEDEDEDNGTKPQMIGQQEMVNTSADDVDTMVDDQPIVLPEQHQEMP